MGVVICSYDGRMYGWANSIEFGYYLGENAEGEPKWVEEPGHHISIEKDESSTDVLLYEILPELKKRYKIGKIWRVNLGVCVQLPFAKKIDNVEKFVESILEEPIENI